MKNINFRLKEDNTINLINDIKMTSIENNFFNFTQTSQKNK